MAFMLKSFVLSMCPQAVKLASRAVSVVACAKMSHCGALAIGRSCFSNKPPSLWTVCQYSTLYKRSLLMSQFERIKIQYPNYILLFQVGDFYELYGTDASEVTSKTSLRLTKKSNVFMAGFPTKSLSEWQRVLVEAGFQLAICDQTTPKEGEKVRLLGREVVKLVTPGTLVEPLDNQANYLLCVNPGPSTTVGLAWLDLSTTEFLVTSTEVQDLEEDIERICPSEVLLPEDVSAALEHGRSSLLSSSPSLDGLVKCSSLRECHVTSIPQSWYSEPQDHHHLDNIEITKHLDNQAFSHLEAMAASLLLWFVGYTQKTVVPFLSPPVRYSRQQHMAIDAGTRRALELVTPLHSNTRKTTLLGCMDRTVTAAGGRLLKARLSSPLTDISEIDRRLDAVELLSGEVFHCEMIIGMLKNCADLERILQKVATNSANISDLQAIKSTLAVAMEITAYIGDNLKEWHLLESDMEGYVGLLELVRELDSALSGGTFGDYIMAGYSEQVDSLRDELSTNAESLSRLTDSLHSSHAGLPKLSIVPHKAYVRVFEVTKTQAARLDRCPELIRVDRTQSKVRYSHVELQRLNAELQRLESLYSTVQSELFKKLCEQVIGEADRIKSTALVLARLDVSSSLGALANERGYSRPSLVGDPVFRVKGATHPVIASVQQGTFISNDCDMNEHKLWVITGPNMGGKSTFLRQNALLAVMAQMGSFVPAEGVILGVVDKLFARVGASDNVTKHQSTFHMEMTEAANILTNATARSFVILDEIGRGTGWCEGVAIAQAIIEYLHDKIGCRTLVATHYHQLSSLADSHKAIGCYKLVADGNEDGILFTYTVEPGYVEESFATQVAKLAGVPQRVVERAEELRLLSRK